MKHNLEKLWVQIPILPTIRLVNSENYFAFLSAVFLSEKYNIASILKRVVWNK